MNSKDKGNITEAALLWALISYNITTLQVFGDNARYDLVIDCDGVFKRIQCKTARLVSDSICFATCSCYAHRRKTDRKTYLGQADYFGVYCPATKDIALVPVEICPVTAMALRRTPVITNKKNIHLLENYTIPKTLNLV